MKTKLKVIFDTLDGMLGDTDPYIDDDMTDDEIREEEPLFWVAKEIMGLIKEYDTRAQIDMAKGALQMNEAMTNREILQQIINKELKENDKLFEAPTLQRLAKGEWFEIILAAGKDDYSILLVSKDTLEELEEKGEKE